MTSQRELADRIADAAEPLGALREAIGNELIGQRAVVDRLLLALLADGHVLLDGRPGLGKTLAVRSLARALSLDFSRIQFTPDLLPADVTGSEVYHAETSRFRAHRGPIFAHLVLADEINRAPARVQSALLEAMEEGQVTLGSETLSLPDPFLVLATRNPSEPRGTWELPESQLDRFLLNVRMSYPSRDEERQILAGSGTPPAPADGVPLDPEALLACRALCREVHVDETLQEYLLDIVEATRAPEAAELQPVAALLTGGISPRGTLALQRAARAHALLERRAWVIPDDIRAVAPDVLRHRLRLTFEAEAQDCTPDEIIVELLSRVPVP